MRWLLITSLAVAIGTSAASAQTKDFWGSPKEVVEQYWNLGIRGELLTPEGWEYSSGFFTKPNPVLQDNTFDVFSNDNGVDDTEITGDTAVVTMGFSRLGRIDTVLRYSPPPKSPFFKNSLLFRLALTPTYIRMFGPDGKTEIGKKPTAESAWEIVENFPRPWATVNAAIRFVLEMRSKTTDPVIKKNADETLAKLLTLH
jgi:hypothetical protein